VFLIYKFYIFLVSGSNSMIFKLIHAALTTQT